MKQINVRLEEGLIKNMKQFALDNGLSVQDVVKLALEYYLNKEVTE